LLNVGDGDTQVLVLPPDSNDHVRRLVIIDVATPRKVPALLDALHAEQIIGPPGTGGQIRLLVATHPHFDHLGGLGPLPTRSSGLAAPVPAAGRQHRRAAPRSSRRLLLGADAQSASSAQTTVDSPDLNQRQNPALAKELRAATAKDDLSADVVKISHHATNQGV